MKETLKGIMLSDLASAASETLREHGDMRVFIDHFNSKHEYAVVEVRRETEPKKKVVQFVIADYIYDIPALSLVK